MHVAVLGPLEVRVDGFPVATERLIEELWSADPPATAAAALQVHVSGLRKVIGAPLCTVPAGYLLDVPADAVDARAFAAAVALARRQHATDPRGAADRLAEALRAWRGPAFDGVPAGPVIRAAAVRLQHLRVGALEDWAEWELRLGRPDRGLLSTLVDRSMLIAQPDAAESRFSMLETIHVYAREQAAGSADLFERRSARAPHRAWYRELVEGAPPLGGDDHELWLARFGAEHDNLRAALDHGVDTDPSSALAIASGLWWFWWTTGQMAEGRAWLDRALAARSAEPAAVRAPALRAAASLARSSGDYDTARAHGQAALDRYREIGDDAGIAAVLNGLCMTSQAQGDLAASLRFGQESEDLARRTGSPQAIAAAVNNIGCTRDGPTGRGRYAVRRGAGRLPVDRRPPRGGGRADQPGHPCPPSR